MGWKGSSVEVDESEGLKAHCGRLTGPVDGVDEEEEGCEVKWVYGGGPA